MLTRGAEPRADDAVSAVHLRCEFGTSSSWGIAED